METKIVVPEMGESVVEATIARWLKKEGDAVDAGEALVELETDKVNLEVGAERSGVLAQILHKDGADVKVGDVLGVLGDRAEGAAESKAETEAPQDAEEPAGRGGKATPSARRLAQEAGVDLAQIKGSGPANQITKQDVQQHLGQLSGKAPAAQPAMRVAEQQKPVQEAKQESKPRPASVIVGGARREERVRMTRRRRTIAQRLVEAQHTAAMLTTYNELDMGAVMDVRKRHKESFKEKYGVGLGIVSFFVKASIGALKEFPLLNAEIQGDEILMKHYYDIGVAIGASEGLVVPVLRDADRMSFAEIESGIKDFARKSEDGTLSLEDLRGGTFTITNGGVFGSLLSTPILNPPQVGILGLHKIEDRPMAVNGQVVIRPMMYVALSYDHRIVDGRESVQFLARLKSLIEDPAALMLL